MDLLTVYDREWLEKLSNGLLWRKVWSLRRISGVNVLFKYCKNGREC